MPYAKNSSKNRTVVVGTFAHVIRAYLTSPKFDSLSENTRRSYLRPLRRAEDHLGAIKATDMRPALVQGFLDGYEGLPAAQKCARGAFKALEAWAIVRDMLPQHITTGTELTGKHGGHKPWTERQVELALQHATPVMAQMIALAAGTGQRGSDLVKMRWSDVEMVDGHLGINVIQRKTGLEVWVPFNHDLAAIIATWEKRPGFLVVKENGRPFERTHLTDRWIHERERNPALAPLLEAGCNLHGLRGTACVRLLRAGANSRQIADCVGMSEEMVQRYTRFSEQRKNALAAIHILNRTTPERARNVLGSNKA